MNKFKLNLVDIDTIARQFVSKSELNKKDKEYWCRIYSKPKNLTTTIDLLNEEQFVKLIKKHPDKVKNKELCEQFNNDCSKCEWKLLTGEACSMGSREKVQTFEALKEAKTIESKYKACKNRANYIKKLLENEKRICHFCGRLTLSIGGNPYASEYYVFCANCGMHGPVGNSRREAWENYQNIKCKGAKNAEET